MHSLLLLNALLTITTALTLPDPNGSYNVDVQVYSLTDLDRMDPYAPPATPHERKVLISMFWPFKARRSCAAHPTSYMPLVTAQMYGLAAEALGLSNETFADFKINFCEIGTVNNCDRDFRRPRLPLAIFSPGAGNSRLLYSAMAKSLASRGYVVVTVDHPYDADIVEFPDGTIILGANLPENKTNLEKATRVRAQDLSFVLSQLQDTRNGSPLTKHLPGDIDFSQVVVYGHSLGGASAAEAMLLDDRILGGADLDGQIFNSVLSQGISRPFLLFGRPDHRTEDTSWVRFWGNLRGPKMEMELQGSVHGSFTDFPVLLHSLGLPDQYQSGIETIVGTMDGIELVVEAIAAFFTFVLHGSTSKLLELVNATSELEVVSQRLAVENSKI